MKNFFSSIWFRCISTLLAIMLVSGGLLSFLNDALAVSDDERAGRAVKKIYGEVEDYNSIYDSEKDALIEYEFGRIDKIYQVQVNEENSFLLFKTTGYDGYKGGTISLWVSVSENESGIYAIEKVILDSYEKQTLMSKLTNEFYNGFCVSDLIAIYENNNLFTTERMQKTKA